MFFDEPSARSDSRMLETPALWWQSVLSAGQAVADPRISAAEENVVFLKELRVFVRNATFM